MTCACLRYSAATLSGLSYTDTWCAKAMDNLLGCGESQGTVGKPDRCRWAGRVKEKGSSDELS